jgi:hypothetical protein
MSRAAHFHAAVGVAAGLLVASGGASAILAFSSGDIRLFTPFLVVVTFVALVFGLPAYMAARTARHDTPVVAAISGFIVGAAIPAVLLLAGPNADEASVGKTATVIGGSYTAAGWLQNLAMLGLFGLAGIAGGLVFWLVMRRQVAGEEPEDEPSPPRLLRTTLLCVAAAGVILAAFLIPRATTDRSCHNPLRNGAQSIRQTAGFDLGVGRNEWPMVEQEIEAFGRAGEWSVRGSLSTDDSISWLQVSLCKEPGTQILVTGLADLNQVSFSVYQPQGGSTWRRDFRALHDRIRARWPVRIMFKDEQGKPTSAPEWAVREQQP